VLDGPDWHIGCTIGQRAFTSDPGHPMRIAMISTPFVPVPPPAYGGTELVVHELVEGLRERGHDVVLFATGDSESAVPTRSMFDVAQWPPDPLTELEHAAWAIAEAAREEFDVVHVHSASAIPVAKAILARPLIYTVHHARDEALSQLYARHPEPFYVFISHAQARRETHVPRCAVIHHGLDPALLEWSPNCPEDYVCFIGRFAREKGPYLAIEAARLAGVPIRVAGEVHEPDRDYAERDVLPRLREPHVTFLGDVGPDMKRPLLRDARALLAPIAWEEPFGLVLIEAMLSGCPVVAFPRGSVPELVEQGVTGFVAHDLEEMTALIRPGGAVDRFDRAECRRRAVERFSRARMAADYEAAYERAVSDGAAAAPCDTAQWMTGVN
jgi:glycosyltransferase involved in cell wall biosynthesis